MNEIELKFKVDNYSKLYETLCKYGGHFSDEIEQKDVVFYEKGNFNYDIDYGTIVIRTREYNGKKILTLKKRASETFACKEIEFEVEKSEKIEDFINTLGFEKTMEFVKKRVEGQCEGFNISLDRLEGIGDYIEIEVLTDSDDIELYKNKIMKFASCIGVNINNLEPRYYPQIIMSRKRKEIFK